MSNTVAITHRERLVGPDVHSPFVRGRTSRIAPCRAVAALVLVVSSPQSVVCVTPATSSAAVPRLLEVQVSAPAVAGAASLSCAFIPAAAAPADVPVAVRTAAAAASECEVVTIGAVVVGLTAMPARGRARLAARSTLHSEGAAAAGS